MSIGDAISLVAVVAALLAALWFQSYGQPLYERRAEWLTGTAMWVALLLALLVVRLFY